MKQAFLYLFAFIAIQVFTIWGVLAVWGEQTASTVITATVIYSIATLALFIWRKWSVVSLNYLRTRPWNVLSWSAVAAVCTILPSAWLQEIMPQLPNNTEETIAMMMDNNLGYLSICILAPVVEELVFRGAVLRSLSEQIKNPWHAIALSALLFALVHANPAQMPHAFIIGLLLGWLYCRTGSILPGVVFHWVNNTVAFVLYRLTPQSQDETIVELFNGNTIYASICIALSLLVLTISLQQLNKRCDNF